MRICVIDYGAGNVRSATRVFQKAAETFGDAQVQLSIHADAVHKADRIVLPGQGAFGDCMKGLSALPGMIDALNEAVIKQGKPFFGICVGMQLLATRGLEHGTHAGLNWIGGEVVPLRNEPSAVAVAPIGAEQSRQLKIPHMGWNSVTSQKTTHPLLKDLPPNPFVYFVHSYKLQLQDNNDALLSCDYGGAFTAAVVKNNICGTQFHPEKSQKIGLQIIRNFLDWAP